MKSSLRQITNRQTPTRTAAGWWQTCKADALRRQNLWHEGSSIMEKHKAIFSSALRVTSSLLKKLNGYESPVSSLAQLNIPRQLTVVPLSYSSLMAISWKQTWTPKAWKAFGDGGLPEVKLSSYSFTQADCYHIYCIKGSGKRPGKLMLYTSRASEVSSRAAPISLN